MRAMASASVGIASLALMMRIQLLPLLRSHLIFKPRRVYNADVDILPAPGLVAVDGEDILTGFERGTTRGGERHQIILGDIAGSAARQHTVDVDLYILIMMHE